MNVSDSYQLLDFGNERKIERFGQWVLDRPSPSAIKRPKRPIASWDSAVRFELESDHQGRWIFAPSKTRIENWQIELHQCQFELKLTPFGHIGIFPEQLDNWQWIQDCSTQLSGSKILNLFAYTGGTTMALARCGAQVVHVDGAANVVKWARKNVLISDLEQTPIRWITEDALKFVHRENKRGNRYDGFVADPPSFGRGPKNERWCMKDDFKVLLEGLAELTDHQPKFILLSNHSPGFEHRQLKLALQSSFPILKQIEHMPMQIKSQAGQLLNAGHVARWVTNATHV